MGAMQMPRKPVHEFKIRLSSRVLFSLPMGKRGPKARAQEGPAKSLVSARMTASDRLKLQKLVAVAGGMTTSRLIVFMIRNTSERMVMDWLTESRKPVQAAWVPTVSSYDERMRPGLRREAELRREKIEQEREAEAERKITAKRKPAKE